MWDLPRPGLKPRSLALAGRFLTTAPPGKPLWCHSKPNYFQVGLEMVPRFLFHVFLCQGWLLLYQGLHITANNFFPIKAVIHDSSRWGASPVIISALSHLVQHQPEDWEPGHPSFSQQFSGEKYVFLLIVTCLTHKCTKQIHTHSAFSESSLTLMKIWGLRETITRLITCLKSLQI